MVSQDNVRERDFKGTEECKREGVCRVDSFSETVVGVPTPDLTGILLYHETTNTEDGTFLGIIEQKLE